MKFKKIAILLLSLAAGMCLLLAIVAVPYVSRMSGEIRAKFDGRRWSLPATVYARPLELYPGLQLSPETLAEELELAGYRHEDREKNAGSYTRSGSTIRLVTREFYFPAGYEPSHHLTIAFAAGQVAALTSTGDGTAVPYARLDPARIGSFHPLVHEDRILLSREEIPDLLVQTLLALEDRDFYTHHGVAPLSVARALLANIKAGKTVQGGSTLTQQLVKNLFLSREQTLLRKAREAVMALLLERYSSKDEILTTYVNEVFLGQDGNRAIHGFALAGQFYFRRSIQDLRADQIAVLVGMIKGPSTYDPRRNPELCLERRNMVLETMAAHDLIDRAALTEALSLPLTEFTVQKGGFNRFPAFLDLVRQQLGGEYLEEDLKTSGLQIITTLDPTVQYQVERGLEKTIAAFAGQPKYENLEGAAVITSRETGEVLAVAGGRQPQDHGFNRALHASRPIGSLVKPAVYLAALEKGYTLASPLDDSVITLETEGGSPWSPENYDKKEHGRIPLYAALAHSYNLATVRLGMEVGLDNVVETLRRLGYQGNPEPFPSLLLGAVDMSPFAVTQIYQTIASGGFFTSLRAIDSVTAADHSLLDRYGLAVEQRFSAPLNFILSHALQRVIAEGTATSLLKSPLKNHFIAGKTGTSDNFRDSWFAGFTGDHLAVVWLGRDDNTPCHLSGSSGALKAWTAIMAGVVSSPLQLVEPEGISWGAVDQATFRESDGSERNAARLPFIAGSEPSIAPDSFEAGVGGLKKEVKGVFETINRWFQ
jgi:penicillin-binding protein 1B